MSEKLMNVADVESVFSDISTMIYTAKNEVMMRVNTSVISLYWNIGKKLSDEVLQINFIRTVGVLIILYWMIS